MKEIEGKSGKQRYHVKAVVDGGVVFDSAFSREDSLTTQILAAVDEYQDGQ